MNKLIPKISTILILIFCLTFSEPISAFAKGSFGGSKGGSSRSFSKPSSSFGGSKSAPSASKPISSFGGSKSTQSAPSMSKPTSSFGGQKSVNRGFKGQRMTNSSQYTGKYGAPRKTVTSNDYQGLPQNYRVNQYGGMSDGFMMGYLMGSSPWYWHTPFHPAFYYSRPNYVYSDDGTVAVYPPTFSFGNVLLVLIVGGSILFIIVVIIRKRKQNKAESFGGSFE